MGRRSESDSLLIDQANFGVNCIDALETIILLA